MDPVWKYPGGKRRLAPAILPLLGLGTAVRYVEPFVGSGAIFLAVRDVGFGGPVILNDSNPRLIATWRAIQQDPQAVLRAFGEHVLSHSQEYYYSVRKKPGALDDVTVAAWFLYVNRACFNGLYRVNSKGEFNVPFGSYPHPPKIDAVNLLNVSHALQGAVIFRADFACLECEPGDAVYCDPPYLPASETASFTGYTKAGFAPSDQLRLASWAKKQAANGATVVISNAGNADAVMAFSSTADQTIPLSDVSRVISCKGGSRKPVKEFLFVYSPGRKL